MESRHRARIVIADDHRLVAEACKSILEPEFQVVAIVADGRALVQAVSELRPDVVVLDIFMPQLNGLDAGEQIKQKNRTIKLVYMTMALGPDVAAEAFRRGASGYVLKQGAAEELIAAMRRVLRGESYLSPLITKDTVAFGCSLQGRKAYHRAPERSSPVARGRQFDEGNRLYPSTQARYGCVS
jgi:DNA-binding NarL/FixJ family response regulator